MQMDHQVTISKEMSEDISQITGLSEDVRSDSEGIQQFSKKLFDLCTTLVNIVNAFKLLEQKISKKIGEMLIDEGLITKEQLKNALGLQKERNNEGKNQKLGEILIEKKYISNGKLLEILQLQSESSMQSH